MSHAIGLPALADIRAAADQIAGVVIRTPFLPAPRLSRLTGADIWVKYENLQATASFKERGALVKLLSLTPDERARGVIAMSAGNHAQAVAYHAQRLGIPATIVMPKPTPFVKIAATRSFGAEVIVSGETLADCHAIVDETVARTARCSSIPTTIRALLPDKAPSALRSSQTVPTSKRSSCRSAAAVSFPASPSLSRR